MIEPEDGNGCAAGRIGSLPSGRARENLDKYKKPATGKPAAGKISGGDGGIRTHVPISGQNDFESFFAYDF